MNPVWYFLNGLPTMGTIAPVSVLSGDGSIASPAWSFGSEQGLGLFRGATGEIGVANGNIAGANPFTLAVSQLRLGSAVSLAWSPNAAADSADTTLARGAAGQINSNSSLAKTGANGQLFHDLQSLTELTTIAAAATTDTTIQMPATSVVLAVSVRVTVVIPTAATFTVGDSGSAARFSTATVSAAANSTDPGTKAGAYYNASALSIRITPNATPAANTGRVRVTIVYYTNTPPTS